MYVHSLTPISISTAYAASVIPSCEDVLGVEAETALYRWNGSQREATFKQMTSRVCHLFRIDHIWGGGVGKRLNIQLCGFQSLVFIFRAMKHCFFFMGILSTTFISTVQVKTINKLQTIDQDFCIKRTFRIPLQGRLYDWFAERIMKLVRQLHNHCFNRMIID